MKVTKEIWLNQLASSENLKPEDILELETHLDDSIEDLNESGLSYEESLLVATKRLGKPLEIANEFSVVNNRGQQILSLLFGAALFPLLQKFSMLFATSIIAIPTFRNNLNSISFFQWQLAISSVLLVIGIIFLAKHLLNRNKRSYATSSWFANRYKLSAICLVYFILLGTSSLLGQIATATTLRELDNSNTHSYDISIGVGLPVLLTTALVITFLPLLLKKSTHHLSYE